ncbi:adhesin, partial [Escherichia coli]|nr:adhesin [Escherichia coli]
WDSIISLDGVEQSEEILRWYTAGSKTVKIESRLYGEEGKRKPGELSGSMTMVLSFL